MILVEKLSHTVQTPAVKGERPSTLTILSDINLEVAEGESLAIVGSSGSGKTTLLGMLAGLDVPSEGFIEVAGAQLTQMNEDQRAAFRAEHVGIIFQSFHLLPALTALENVLLPLELAKQANSEARATELLEKVGLAARIHHKPAEMSGGEQQRVAIARAFAANAKVLFADEPTGNLDFKTGEQITELLFDLNQAQGTTLILVTHDLSLAQRCDRCVQLQGGRIIEQG